MTDREYEKMMVEAVNGGADISHVMHVLNTKIAVAEQMVESLYETRRELINRFNLNKCEHEFDYNPKDMCGQCIKCGQLSINGEYQLAAFKVLLMLLRGEEEKMNACEHDYRLHLVDGVHRVTCLKCGKAYEVA